MHMKAKGIFCWGSLKFGVKSSQKAKAAGHQRHLYFQSKDMQQPSHSTLGRAKAKIPVKLDTTSLQKNTQNNCEKHFGARCMAETTPGPLFLQLSVAFRCSLASGDLGTCVRLPFFGL